jgi:dihydrofolate reductase
MRKLILFIASSLDGYIATKTGEVDWLFDELILSIHPIILGEGIGLFRSPLSVKKLNFQHCQAFNTGLVQLTYTRERMPAELS